MSRPEPEPDPLPAETAPPVASSAPVTGSATDAAAILQTGGEREAAVLQTAGLREADVLQTAGARQASILRTAGQRRVNLIWETTQSAIAVAVSGGTLIVAVRLALLGKTDAVNLLSNAFFLVIGFYFGRTNHQRVGGVGQHDTGR